MPSVPALLGYNELDARDAVRRAAPIPALRIAALASPVILDRAAETSVTSIAAAGASHTCGPHDNTGFCQKYVTSDTETLPIVLGVVIPLVSAFVLFLFLHRRHKRKLKQEDANDVHKSLDFGLGEDHIKEKSLQKGNNGDFPRRERGLSMDLDMANPYLLPPGLESSRESLHSLSRTLNMADDKYRSSALVSNDGHHSYPSSLRSPVGDDGSSLTAPSSRMANGSSNKNLLNHVQPTSRSQSPFQSVSATDRTPLAPPKNNLLAAPGNGIPRDSYMSTNSSIGPIAALRASNNYLGQFISGGGSPDTKETERFEKQDNSNIQPFTLPTAPQAPEKAIIKDSTDATRRSIGQVYAPAAPPKVELATFHAAATVPHTEDSRQPRLPSINFSNTLPLSQGLNLSDTDVDDHQHSQSSHRHSASKPISQDADDLCPEPSTLPEYNHEPASQQPALPVSDLPHLAEHEHQQQAQYEDQAEDDDYYDDDYDYADAIGYDPRHLTAMGERPLPPDDPSENPEQRANRIRSFYKEYFDENNKPARAPSIPSKQDYYDGSENYTYDGYDVNQYYDDRGSYPSSRNQSRGPSRQANFAGPEGRHRATISTGSFQAGRAPRAYSSTSGQYGPPGRRGPAAKKLPPPKPLMSLPTPHMLKDDTFIPTDFAPPGAFKGQRAGTPDSLRGEMKPYRKQRAHIPLASSFDDLAVMPSPHALRKSSTFTALDFAPPPKLKSGSQYGGSDAGSVRSGHSNASAAHIQRIRTGAYRVSRIPKEVSGTKDELQNALRPTWDMNR